MKNLIIAAHPDDEILGCGGLISKLKKSNIDSFVLVLTSGCETRYPKKMQGILKNSAIKANEIVGTKKVYFEHLPNQQLDAIPLIKIIKTIEVYLNKINPDTVFTHHGGDLNKDHRIAYEATMTAARPIRDASVKVVYVYSVCSSTEWGSIDNENIFIPSVFVDIKKELNSKIEAMKCYETECRAYPHPRSAGAIKAYAHYWGLSSGMEYVEPFRLIRDTTGKI